MAGEMNNNDEMMRQSQMQQMQAMRQAQQKQSEPAAAPRVKFAEVMKSQLPNQSATGSKLLATNPVAGAQVISSALTANKGSGKLASSPTATTAPGSTVNNNVSTSGTSTSTSADSSGQALLAATGQMQEMNQDFNLQYLGLQENMQQESRQFTSMSNVSKTKSDTAKNSLSNIK